MIGHMATLSVDRGEVVVVVVVVAVWVGVGIGMGIVLVVLVGGGVRVGEVVVARRRNGTTGKRLLWLRRDVDVDAVIDLMLLLLLVVVLLAVALMEVDDGLMMSDVEYH